MTQTSNEISVYKGELSKETFGRCCNTILKVYPRLTDTIEILKKRLVANGFNDERLIASIEHVIDNFDGWNKHPSIADFIKFDKKVKIYEYHELLSECVDFAPEERKKFLEMFAAIDTGLEKPRWAKVEHVEEYKIKKWRAKTNGKTNF